MITEFSDQEMDKHKSMLLIGAGKTNKYLKEIVRPEYVQEAGEVFGTCALVSMYELLISGHEEEDIFLMNIEDKYDYLLIAPLLSEYDFSYIIPLDIFLSDYFFDSLNDGKRTYYLKQVIKQTAGKNHTIFLVTDKHASLYQNMDLFLDEMHQNETKFRGSSDFSLVKENLIFVANNLQEVPWGNVWLARMILNTEANEYP